MESRDEHARHENGNIPRDAQIVSAETLALRALIDAIGSFVVIDTPDEPEVIEVAA